MGGIASKRFAKGQPKSRKIANFDNIKGNVNEMKTYKTKFWYKMKTEEMNSSIQNINILS